MEPVKSEYIPRYTYEDYVQWEGDWELINGLPYAMAPAPVLNHQIVFGHITRRLEESLDNCERCTALAEVDWKIAENTVVRPDNLVICGEVGGAYLTKAPVLIFEILSPATSYKDRNIKYQLYEREGVKYYILVDIEALVAEVFELKNKKYAKIADVQTDVIKFDLGPCSIDFDFGKIWKKQETP
jgi:Uma2 family endonuclease